MATLSPSGTPTTRRVGASSSAPLAATARSGLDATTAIALRERLYAPLKIAAVVQVLADAGVDRAATLAGTGLTVEQAANPDTRTSLAQLMTVGRNAVRLAPTPDLGLKSGLRMHATSYGMYGYALLCAETMRHAFDMAVRYHRLATPVMPALWVEDGDRAIWMQSAHEALHHLELNRAEYRFFLDMQVTLTFTLIRDVMGPWCIPARVAYATPVPAHAEEIARALACPVSFDQPRTELHYPAAWLDRAPQLTNPITAVQMSSTCSRLMEAFTWQTGLTRRVYDELTRTPGRFPEIDAVAASLCMTSRTLRRKLEAEGSSYSNLLASVRHALAVDYLNSTLLGIEDIAAALGFSDAASFRHAFKRWTGKTPNEYRA